MATIGNKRRFLQFKGVNPTQYLHAIALLVIICVLASPYRKDDNGVGIIIPLQKGGLSYEKGTVSQT